MNICVLYHQPTVYAQGGNRWTLHGAPGNGSAAHADDSERIFSRMRFYKRVLVRRLHPVCQPLIMKKRKRRAPGSDWLSMTGILMNYRETLAAQ